MSRGEDIVVTNTDAQLHFKHLAGQYFSVNCRLSKDDKTKTDFFIAGTVDYEVSFYDVKSALLSTFI